MAPPIYKGHTPSGSYHPSSSAEASNGSAKEGVLAKIAERDKQRADAAQAKRDDAKTKKGFVRASELFRVWSAAHLEVFPGIPVTAWGKKEEGQATLVVKGFGERDDAPRGTFLDWLVREWRLIITARFAWMKESPAPEFPAIGFVLGFREKFYDAWKDRARLRQETNLTGRDRQVRKAMRHGMGFDEAVGEAAERDSLAAERQRLQKKEADLNRLAAGIDDRRKLVGAAAARQLQERQRAQPVSADGGEQRDPGHDGGLRSRRSTRAQPVRPSDRDAFASDDRPPTEGAFGDEF